MMWAVMLLLSCVSMYRALHVGREKPGRHRERSTIRLLCSPALKYRILATMTSLLYTLYTPLRLLAQNDEMATAMT